MYWPRVDVPSAGFQWIVLLEEGEWDAMPIRWACPWEVQRQWPSVAGAMPTGLCAVPLGPPEPILTVAAKHAFWMLPKTTLDAWSKELVVEQPSGADLFTTLWNLVERVLQPIGENDIMDILMRRLANLAARERPGTEELMQLDEGNKLFTKEEEADLRVDRKPIVAERVVAKSFAKRWTEKRAALPRPKAKASSKGKGAPKGACRSARGAQSKYLPRVPAGQFTQAQVRQPTPDGGSLWIGNSRGNWNGHYPPFQRCSAFWAQHGQRGACLVVLRTLWRQHLVSHGLSAGDCPIQGMLEGGDDPLSFLDASA